jgi:hypothetical protein
MYLSFGPTNVGILVLGCLVSLWAARTYVRYRRLMVRIGDTPGPAVFFTAATVITRFLPNIPRINRKGDWLWKQKYNGMYHFHKFPFTDMTRMPDPLATYAAFQQYGQDVIASVTFYPSPRALISIADPKIVKVSTRVSSRPLFDNPIFVGGDHSSFRISQASPVL